MVSLDLGCILFWFCILIFWMREEWKPFHIPPSLFPPLLAICRLHPVARDNVIHILSSYGASVKPTLKSLLLYWNLSFWKLKKKIIVECFSQSIVTTVCLRTAVAKYKRRQESRLWLMLPHRKSAGEDSVPDGRSQPHPLALFSVWLCPNSMVARGVRVDSVWE